MKRGRSSNPGRRIAAIARADAKAEAAAPKHCRYLLQQCSQGCKGDECAFVATAEELDEWLLQDTRSLVGNDVVFWAKDGQGYTTDLRRAHVYTKAKAYAQHECRATDLPWPKAYMLAKARPAVDFQYIDHTEALASAKTK